MKSRWGIVARSHLAVILHVPILNVPSLVAPAAVATNATGDSLSLSTGGEQSQVPAGEERGDV